jgi:hypothetical protein
MSAPVWPSGIGGAQCDECGETTVVRPVDDEASGYICRACLEGWNDEPDQLTDEDIAEERLKARDYEAWSRL